jgi:hypothetical protein
VLFEHRWRIAVGRIAAEARPINRAVLLHLCRGSIEHAALTAALNWGGSAGRGGPGCRNAHHDGPIMDVVFVLQLATDRSSGINFLRLLKVLDPVSGQENTDQDCALSLTG